jgi:hypothetical protein
VRLYQVAENSIINLDFMTGANREESIDEIRVVIFFGKDEFVVFGYNAIVFWSFLLRQCKDGKS